MQTPARTKAKKGRVPKGDRVGTLVRLPIELRKQAQAIATQEHLPLGDVITRMVAEPGLGVGQPLCHRAPIVRSGGGLCLGRKQRRNGLVEVLVAEELTDPAVQRP